MAGAYIQWVGGGELLFDITTGETHEGTLTITQFPVEDGPDVADHAREELQKLTLDVFVSNAPIEDLNRGMSKQVVTLDVPKFQPPLTPTPGAIYRAGKDAIKNAFGGPSEPIQQQVLKAASQFNAVRDTEVTLRTLQRDKTLVQVFTSLRDYENLILESWECTRDEDAGDGAAFTLHFIQMRVVESRIVTAPKATEPRGQKPVSKGAKPTAAPEAKKQSIAKKLADLAGILK